jgi:hypothetical protein
MIYDVSATLFPDQRDVPATLFPALYAHNQRKNRTMKKALTDNKRVMDVDQNMSQQIIT